jgi:hypothetical protein
MDRKEDKHRLRALRNRQSAFESRQRHHRYVGELERERQTLFLENRVLAGRILQLEDDKGVLRGEVERLKSQFDSFQQLLCARARDGPGDGAPAAVECDLLADLCDGLPATARTTTSVPTPASVDPALFATIGSGPSPSAPPGASLGTRDPADHHLLPPSTGPSARMSSFYCPSLSSRCLRPCYADPGTTASSLWRPRAGSRLWPLTLSVLWTRMTDRAPDRKTARACCSLKRTWTARCLPKRQK